MNMLGIAPKASQKIQTSPLDALLQFMADPARLKEALEELKAQQIACNAAFETANKAIAALNKQQADLEEREQELGDREKVLEEDQAKFEKDRAEWAVNIAQREAKIVQANDLLNDAKAQLANDKDRIQAMLDIAEKRKADLDARETELVGKEKAAEAMRAEAQAAVARMEKALRGQ